MHDGGSARMKVVQAQGHIQQYLFTGVGEGDSCAKDTAMLTSTPHAIDTWKS